MSSLDHAIKYISRTPSSRPGCRLRGRQAGGEHYMASFYHSCGFETVSLRYFNLAGPRQDPSCPYSGVLARFTTQMLAGEQPTIFGDVEQSPDFTYIANVVQGNLLAASAPPEQCAGRVFNVGAGGWKQLPA